MHNSINIAIVGIGNIGEWILSKLCDEILRTDSIVEKILCIDINYNTLESKVSDVIQSLLLKIPVYGKNKIITLINAISFSTTYEHISLVDYIITAYSVPLNEKIKERSDLLIYNDKITQNVAKNILKNTSDKNYKIINIANPLDITTWRMQELTGVPHNQVIGISGIIDCTRFAQSLHENLNICYSDINFNSLKVLGEHGPSMLPILRQATVNNYPLNRIDEKTKKEICHDTAQKGTNMLLANNKIAPHIAIAQGVINCLFAWISQRATKMCLSVWNEDYKAFYGSEVYISLDGIIHTDFLMSLTPEEQELFHKSVKNVRECYKFLSDRQ